MSRLIRVSVMVVTDFCRRVFHVQVPAPRALRVLQAVTVTKHVQLNAVVRQQYQVGCAVRREASFRINVAAKLRRRRRPRLRLMRLPRLIPTRKMSSSAV
jgi:hypothetical protein